MMDVDAVERGLAEIRQEMRKLREEVVSTQLPSVLTVKRAARELSISPTTAKLMIKRGEMQTVPIGKRRMVPASEIRRLASVDRKTTPAPPTRSGLQDPESGRNSLRKRGR